MNTITDRHFADLKLHFDYAVPAHKLFAALTTEEGLKGWCTQFCEVDGAVGGISVFRFPADGFYYAVKTVEKREPDYLEWECVESRHSEKRGYADLTDWVGTRLSFAITDLGEGRSHLDFTHAGLAALECAENCVSSWAFFIGQSLRDYLETGKGQPWDRAA